MVYSHVGFCSIHMVISLAGVLCILIGSCVQVCAYTAVYIWQLLYSYVRYISIFSNVSDTYLMNVPVELLQCVDC